MALFTDFGPVEVHRIYDTKDNNTVMNIIRFLKTWTLPVSMMAGGASYFIYVNMPFFAPTRPYANAVVGVVQPVLIFSMLFLTFCKISFKEMKLKRWHLWHALIQATLFTVLAGVLIVLPMLHSRVIVESAMLCLLCPTATAAAVVTS